MTILACLCLRYVLQCLHAMPSVSPCHELTCTTRFLQIQAGVQDLYSKFPELREKGVVARDVEQFFLKPSSPHNPKRYYITDAMVSHSHCPVSVWRAPDFARWLLLLLADQEPRTHHQPAVPTRPDWTQPGMPCPPLTHALQAMSAK